MKNKLDNSAFTLIEIIIALALIGIIAISFLTIFSSAYAYLFTAGRKSDAIFAVEKVMESSIASGTSSEANTIAINIGGRNLEIKGVNTSQNQLYENDTKNVSMNMFITNNSISSKSNLVNPDLDLEIYANELEIMINETYKLEANKAVTWSSSSPSIASVSVFSDRECIISGLNFGSSTITASDGITTKTCIVNVVPNVTLRYVKGGQYVQYGGNNYIKLTGENGRVMYLSGPTIGNTWSEANNMPYKGELEGDEWTNSLRSSAGNGLQYWTKTKTNANVAYYVKADGTFDTKNTNNSTSGLKLTTDLNPELRISSGTGAFGSPYILID
jgi:prepilin-type N-terminal cleavage/methylation domain-containing protein